MKQQWETIEDERNLSSVFRGVFGTVSGYEYQGGWSMDCSSESGKMARSLFYVSIVYLIENMDFVVLMMRRRMRKSCFGFSVMEFICHLWETRLCSKRYWRFWKRQIGSLVCTGDRWKMSLTKIHRTIHFLMMEDHTIIYPTGSSLTTTTGIRTVYRNLVNCLQKPWNKSAMIVCLCTIRKWRWNSPCFLTLCM